MKKNKRIISLLIASIFFILVGLIFYKQSVTLKVPEKVSYNEKSNIKYKVYLTDSKYYNKKYLDEGMQYISSIIDYIKLDFNYSVKYDKNVDYKVNNKIKSNIEIVDSDNNDKVIYKEEEILKEIKEEKTNDYINISNQIDIDYKKYNKLTNEFKSSYGISAKCKLVISYNIEINGKTSSITNINEIKTLKVEIPLSEQMIDIQKSNDINKSDVYEEITTKGDVNKTLIILSIIFILLGILTLILFVFILLQGRKKQSKYDKYINKLLRQYDSYITEVSDIADANAKTFIKVDSFKELLDVRNNIEKAILYIKDSNDLSRFIIINDKEVYEYRVIREEFM